MEQVSNIHIDEFRGYLKSLSRLCGNRHYFGVAAYDSSISIDDLAFKLIEFWRKEDDTIPLQYNGCRLIDSKDLFAEIENYIFNGILRRSNMPNDSVRNYATKMLTEDINEYYGLVSVSLNKNGIFHPLLSSNVYVLDIVNPKYEKTLYYVVKIENIYVYSVFVIKHKV